MTDMPETPADCLDGITMSPMHRGLIIARIEYLIRVREWAAAMTAIEQSHKAAVAALIAPVTQAEIEKPS